MTRSLSDFENRYWETRVARASDTAPESVQATPETVAEMSRDIDVCPITAVYPIKRDAQVWDVYIEVATETETVWMRERVHTDTYDAVTDSVLFEVWDEFYSDIEDITETPLLVGGIQDILSGDRQQYSEIPVGTTTTTYTVAARYETPSAVRYARTDTAYHQQRTDFITTFGLWSLYKTRTSPVPMIIMNVNPITDVSLIVTATAAAAHLSVQWIVSLDDENNDNQSSSIQLLDSIAAGRPSQLEGQRVYVAPVPPYESPLFTSRNHDHWGIYTTPPSLPSSSKTIFETVTASLGSILPTSAGERE